MYNVEIGVDLVWNGPIGHLCFFEFRQCQVLSFERTLTLSFVPVIGMMLLISPAGIRAAGSDSDPIDLTVESILWSEESNLIVVAVKQVDMGKPPRTGRELMKSVEWMQQQGFRWADTQDPKALSEALSRED